MTALIACACQRKPAPTAVVVEDKTSPANYEFVGQLLLPPGEGSRGVEVVITTLKADGKLVSRWLLFDEQGRFSEELSEELVRLSVSTGLSAELYRLESNELPQRNSQHQVDVGRIDLRHQLTRHRMRLRAAEGAAGGKVRIALCFGPPPTGPNGEQVALGSRQFPPRQLGSEVEWLLPPDAKSVYFLVERPAESKDPKVWRSGYQKLFGPYSAATLPSELRMD